MTAGKLSDSPYFVFLALETLPRISLRNPCFCFLVHSFMLFHVGCVARIETFDYELTESRSASSSASSIPTTLAI
jgi:hypothetical protein